jgi:uncharacterized repeat protein (TIGR01451 family)
MNSSLVAGPAVFSFATASPSITLTKSASPTSVKAGDEILFAIEYRNTGKSSVADVVITDAIPAGSTLVAGSISGGGTVSGGAVTWNLGTVAVGATGIVSFKVIAQ